MEIKNVDENRNILENVDWSVWRRVRVEEILDDDGKLVDLISHCERIPREELDAKALSEIEQKLQATDYISAKLGDALMSCSDVSEMLSVMSDYQNTYGDVIAQRQQWRDRINILRKEN